MKLQHDDGRIGYLLLVVRGQHLVAFVNGQTEWCAGEVLTQIDGEKAKAVEIDMHSK
jgi:hypothetical protein